MQAADDDVTIWIVEDDPGYAEMLQYILGHTSGLAMPLVFSSFEHLEEEISGNPDLPVPGCLLLDIGLPGKSGIDAIRSLREDFPTVPVLMLTNRDSQTIIRRAMAAGAAGYLLKDTELDVIVDAVRRCCQGGVFFPPNVAETVLALLRTSKVPEDYGLTAREMQLIRHMVAGLVHKQIADALEISPYTVENHCRSIYRKLGVHSGIQAVSKAVNEGLV